MKNTKKPAEYRTESGSLYRYSESHNAYLFSAKLNGRTKKQAIKDVENLYLSEEQNEN